MKLAASFFALMAFAYAAPTPQHQHGQGAAPASYNSPSKSPMPAGMNMPPTPSANITPGKPQCEYSFFEKSNLGHNHDVNTGKIKGGSTVVPYAPAILGSGCSPAWAVGGAIDDETPTKTPGDMKLSLWGGIT